MTELATSVNQERETAGLHPLLIIALCIVVFLEIHPFQDSNGRLSRVLTTLLLLQAGYAYVPWGALESVVEREKIVLAAMPELQLQIVEFAREHGRVTIGVAIKLTAASRNILKQHLRALVGRTRRPQPHGSGRGVWYDLRGEDDGRGCWRRDRFEPFSGSAPPLG